jgi:hypothetical protein
VIKRISHVLWCVLWCDMIFIQKSYHITKHGRSYTYTLYSCIYIFFMYIRIICLNEISMLLYIYDYNRLGMSKWKCFLVDYLIALVKEYSIIQPFSERFGKGSLHYILNTLCRLIQTRTIQATSILYLVNAITDGHIKAW